MFTDEQKELIKKRDNYRCQLDLLFGISGLTNVPCSDRLEVHHKTYKRAKNNGEEIEDGITACKRCHELLTDGIRRRRYTGKKIALVDTKQKIKYFILEVTKHERIKVQDYRGNTLDSSQRTASESIKPYYQAD